MKLYQVWIRKYEASCSHTETVYIKATDLEQAWERAEALFSGTFAVKSVRPPGASVVQERCDCGGSITHYSPQGDCTTDPNSNDYTGSRAGFPADGI